MPDFPSPAKINLFLRILGRRDDGFHELETAMAPLEFGDSIAIQPEEPWGSVRFSCDDQSVPQGPDNLVMRAVELARREHGSLPGLAVILTKRTPMGAGLGGGSSNAALALREANALAAYPVSHERLLELAAELGSDVPFFLMGGSCLARGRGEILAPLEGFNPQNRRVMLIKPPFGIPTPWAYQHWKDSVEIPGAHYAPQRWEGMELFNDLERPAFEKYPVLAALKNWLLAQPGVAAALMSGSGSTMVAYLGADADCAALEAGAREWLGEAWFCHTEISKNSPDFGLAKSAAGIN